MQMVYSTKIHDKDFFKYIIFLNCKFFDKVIVFKIFYFNVYCFIFIKYYRDKPLYNYIIIYKY